EPLTRGTPLADTRPDEPGPPRQISHATPFVAPAGPSTPASGRYLGTGSRGFREEGERFGAYELHGELGRGGMGVVYKARRPGLDRFVALKILLGSETASQTRVKRFRREAELAAKLRHVGIVQVHDFGQVGEHYFLTMDFVEGKPLSDLLVGQRAMSLSRAAEIGRDSAEALDHAHASNVIHRDIKPANIMITPEGRPVLTDFGLARQAELDGETTQLTRDGALVGTPFYMSPEQATGKREKVVPKSDVWSLGVVLYQMVCGALPFDGTSQFELSNKVLHEEPTPPRDHRADLDEDLVTILLKTLEKEPDQRYSARELADELTRYLAGDALDARPRSRLETLSRKLAGRRPAIYAGATIVVALELALWGGLQANLRLEQSAAGSALEQRLNELREASAAARRDRLARERTEQDAARDALARAERLGQEAQQANPGQPYLDALLTQLDAIETALSLPLLADSARLYVLRGRALARRHEPDAAREALQQALALDPSGRSGAEAAYKLAGLRDRERDGTKAHLVLATALPKLDPKLAGAWVPLIEASLEVLKDNPDLEAARAALERARDLDARLPEVYLLLALIARSRLDAEGTRRAIERMTQLDPKSATAWTEYARLVVTSDARRGRDLTERALKLDPTFPPALELKALLLEAEGKPKEALAVLRRLVKEVPGDADLLFLTAIVAVESKEEAFASELLHSLERLEPNSHRPYLLRAVALFVANEHEPALAELRRGSELLADRLPAAAAGERRLRKLFEAYVRHLARADLLRNYAESRQRAGDLNGDMLLASIRLAKGEVTEVRQLIKANLTKSPLHAETLRLRFELLGKEGKLAPILAEIRRLEVAAHDDLEALLIVARATVVLLKDEEETARVTQRLVELAPKDSRVLFYRAQVEVRQSPSRAILTLLGILRADPTDTNAAHMLATIFLSSDEPERALTYLENAARFDPFDEATTHNLVALLSRKRPRSALAVTSRYIEFYDSAKVTPSPVIVRSHVSILVGLGKPESGITLAKALFKRYKRHEYLLAAAEALIAIRELGRAKAVIETLRKVAPKSPTLRKLEARLKDLGG
ncbi:MAG: protein kinase, partial [Planctomycetes bacterium]|nr:protein kinase [Planctomycetota bacterium]